MRSYTGYRKYMFSVRTKGNFNLLELDQRSGSQMKAQCINLGAISRSGKDAR